MRRILSFKLFESFDQSLHSRMQQSYEDFEKGLIRAWGGLLYLGYHNLPEDGPTVSRNRYKSELEEYFNMDYDDPEFEAFEDWFSEMPPTIGGRPLFNKSIVRDDFEVIASKTPTPEDMIVYRTSVTEQPGLNSYTQKPGEYEITQGKGRAYKIPKGTPLVFASDIADNGEIIWAPTQEELDMYRVEPKLLDSETFDDLQSDLRGLSLTLTQEEERMLDFLNTMGGHGYSPDEFAEMLYDYYHNPDEYNIEEDSDYYEQISDYFDAISNCAKFDLGGPMSLGSYQRWNDSCIERSDVYKTYIKMSSRVS